MNTDTGTKVINAEGFELAVRLREGIYANVVGLASMDEATKPGTPMNKQIMGSHGLYMTSIDGTALLIDVAAAARERGLGNQDGRTPDEYLRLLLQSAPAVV